MLGAVALQRFSVTSEVGNPHELFWRKSEQNTDKIFLFYFVFNLVNRVGLEMAMKSRLEWMPMKIKALLLADWNLGNTDVPHRKWSAGLGLLPFLLKTTTCLVWTRVEGLSNGMVKDWPSPRRATGRGRSVWNVAFASQRTSGIEKKVLLNRRLPQY